MKSKNLTSNNKVLWILKNVLFRICFKEILNNLQCVLSCSNHRTCRIPRHQVLIQYVRYLLFSAPKLFPLNLESAKFPNFTPTTQHILGKIFHLGVLADREGPDSLLVNQESSFIGLQLGLSDTRTKRVTDD